jgi:hypothetical protein
VLTVSSQTTAQWPLMHDAPSLMFSLISPELLSGEH